MVPILMMSAELATPDFLNLFWNKDYEVMIFVFDITNKILSRNSNSIVDLVMLPKFANSSISMRKVTLMRLKWIWPEKTIFLRSALDSSSIILDWQ